MDNKEISQKVWNTIQNGIKAKIAQSTIHDEIDNMLLSSCTKREYQQLIYRKDNRNWPQFFLDIKKGTDDELATLKKWKIDMLGRGVTVRGQNNGIDNTGLPVIFATKLGRPDYRISLNNGAWFLLDVKNNASTDKFMTFKVSDLKRYADKGSFILICMPTRWVVFGPKFMRGLLKDWPREIFPRFAPGKEAIRITQEQYAKLSLMGALLCQMWNTKIKVKMLPDKEITFNEYKNQNIGVKKLTEWL